MKKLIQGIIQFREERRGDFLDTFQQLAQGQKPDALLIACSDSRMAVNVFASTDPGDLFVIRNVGNLVPPFSNGHSIGIGAAVDFAIGNLGIKDIIVCGHSNCGAMQAHCKGHQHLPEGPLRQWLQAGATGPVEGGEVNLASKKNVLEQLDHLKGYPSVAAAMENGLGLHGLWFDIGDLSVHYYEADRNEWTLLDGEEGEKIIARIDSAS